MDYYGYGWLSEEQRRKQEETREKNREALRRYWDNITPEQREERKAKAAETRRRNAELARQRRIEAAEAQAKKEDRYRRAAETRRRNQGFEGLEDWEIKQIKRQRKKAAKEAEYGPPKPDARRSVPGGFGLYDFQGILRSYIAKRETFWLYVDQSGGVEACWPWHGERGTDYHTGDPTEYGSVSWEGRPTGAHRVAWMLDSGYYIPPGLVIDHMCCCTWCVNPRHLLCTTGAYNTTLRRYRPSELTRTRTSFEPPWDDRWYPQGRRPRQKAERKPEPPPPLPPSIPLGTPGFTMGIDGPPLIPDDEEF